MTYTVSGLEKCYNRFRWSLNSLNPFEPIRAIGYAYGIHRVDDRQMCVVRGFQGYDLYTVFREVGSGQDISGEIDRISVRYEPAVKMKMFSIERR